MDLAVGVLISEVWFGWATQEELQPNIDGLSFDEVLLDLAPGVVALLLIRSVRVRDHSPKEPSVESRRPRRGTV